MNTLITKSMDAVSRLMRQFNTHAFRPLLHLSPLLAAVVAFALVVDTPQGLALAEQYRIGDLDTAAIVLLAVFTWALMACATSLTLVVSGSYERSSDPRLTRCRSLTFAIWVASVPGAMVGVLAWASGFWQLWLIILTGVVIATVIAHRRASSMGRLQTVMRQWISNKNKRRATYAVFAGLLAIGPLALGAGIAVTDPMKFSGVGPLLVAMVGFAGIATTVSMVVIVIPLAVGRPILSALPALMVAFQVVVRPASIETDNPLLRASAKAAYASQHHEKDCRQSLFLDSELKKRLELPDLQGESQVQSNLHFVSAEGGGIRAAYWAALSLAYTDVATAGQFGDRVASVSGVSGGSLGIATWVAARERVDLSPADRVEIIDRYLGSDFLSPLIGGMLFLDVPRLLMGPLWPGATRANVFELAIHQRWQEIAGTNFFARPLNDLCVKGFRRAPMIFFNATDADTGNYVALSQMSFPDSAGPTPMSLGDFEETSLSDASVAQMIHISARFPYVSPAAAVGLDLSLSKRDAYFYPFERPHESKEATMWERLWLLVDGGYYDNTGLTPTIELLETVADRRREELDEPDSERPFTDSRIMVWHISSDPGPTCTVLPEDWRKGLSTRASRYFDARGFEPECVEDVANAEAAVSKNSLSQLRAPVDAILSVRNAHSRETASRVAAQVDQLTKDGRDHFWDVSIARALQFASTGVWSGTGVPLLDSIGLGMMGQGKTGESLLDEALAYRRRLANRYEGEIRENLLNGAREFDRQMRPAAMRSGCELVNDLTGPPLGWTLNSRHRAQMRCLAFRESLPMQSR